MHSYKEFKLDVLTIFQEEIDRYDLNYEVKYEDEYLKKVYCVKLYNNDFEIEFNLDRMDLYAEIINPKNKNSFSFNSVFFYLYPNFDDSKIFYECKEKSKQTKGYIRCQLKYYHNVLNNYLQNILFGDFGWSEKLERIENDKKRILGKIRKLGYDHFLYQLALVKGDTNWYKKAKFFFNENV